MLLPMQHVETFPINSGKNTSKVQQEHKQQWQQQQFEQMFDKFKNAKAS